MSGELNSFKSGLQASAKGRVTSENRRLEYTQNFGREFSGISNEWEMQHPGLRILLSFTLCPLNMREVQARLGNTYKPILCVLTKPLAPQRTLRNI